MEDLSLVEIVVEELVQDIRFLNYGEDKQQAVVSPTWDSAQVTMDSAQITMDNA